MWGRTGDGVWSCNPPLRLTATRHGVWSCTLACSPYPVTRPGWANSLAAAAQCAPPSPHRYQRHRPERTLWYRIVQTHPTTWVEFASGEDDGAPPARAEPTGSAQTGRLRLRRKWPAHRPLLLAPLTASTQCQQNSARQSPSGRLRHLDSGHGLQVVDHQRVVERIHTHGQLIEQYAIEHVVVV